MSTSPSYLTHTLPESSLTQEGYIRFKGFPIAYVKSNLSVLLLLPFEELKRRPYYSATFNGFIELHFSVSRLCPRFTLALIEEWGSRYFGAPGDVARNLYIKEAIKRLCGWHMGQADLAFLRWVSEKWTSRNNLGDNYVLGGVHYETSASTVHCRVQKERC